MNPYNINSMKYESHHHPLAEVPKSTSDPTRQALGSIDQFRIFGPPEDVLCLSMGRKFPAGATPIAGWFIRENPIKMDDLGSTPISGNLHFWFIFLDDMWFMSWKMDEHG